MSTIVKPIVRLFMFVSFLFTSISMVHAAPSLWWDHLERPQGEEQINCVKQGASLLMKDGNHHVTVDSDSVRYWSDQTLAIVECIQFGEKLVAAILVTGSEASEGNRLFTHIRDGLRQSRQINPAP